MALRVKEAHAFDLGGVPVVMKVGMLVADDDPRVKGKERYYEAADKAAERMAPRPESAVAVETATAEPGERRKRSRGSDSNE